MSPNRLAAKLAFLEGYLFTKLGSGSGSGSALVHAWADNAANVGRTLSDQYAASVTVTPQVTGKFRVIGTVIGTYSGGAIPAAGTSQSFMIKVGHTVGAGLVTDYTPAQSLTFFVSGSAVAGPGVSNASVSIQYEYTVAFPIGAAVTLGLILASGDSGVTISAHGAQLTVQELNN